MGKSDRFLATKTGRHEKVLFEFSIPFALSFPLAQTFQKAPFA